MPTIEKRQLANRETRYRVKVRRKGQPPQTATFRRLTDAKRWAHQAEAAALEGRHFKHTEAKRRTVQELVDRYCLEVLPEKSRQTARKQSRQLEAWASFLGRETPLADVTPARIAEYRDRLVREGRSGPTANRYLAALSHAFTVARKEWGWVAENPVMEVSKKKENPGRLRYLSPEEIERLLAACEESSNRLLHTVVLLALTTGMRKGEILGLTWDRVDLKTGRVTLEETKNGERRIIPVPEASLKELQEVAVVRRIDSSFVFPGANPMHPIELRKPWEKALREAEIEDFRFHDLRHTAASYLAMDGVDMLTIADILGHKTLQMVKRYSHLADEHRANALNRLAEIVMGGINAGQSA